MFFHIRPLLLKTGQSILARRLNIPQMQNPIRFLGTSNICKNKSEHEENKVELKPPTEESLQKMKKYQKYFQEQEKKGIPVYLQGPKDKMIFNITLTLIAVGLVFIIHMLVVLILPTKN